MKPSPRIETAGRLLPFCVVGTAGSDDPGLLRATSALADVCADEKLWLHIGGAFGPGAGWRKRRGAMRLLVSNGLTRWLLIF